MSAEKLASNQDFIGTISVDDTHVYWANPFDRSINRVEVKGGSVESFITNVFDPGSVVIDDQFVYFSTQTEGMIKKFAIDLQKAHGERNEIIAREDDGEKLCFADKARCSDLYLTIADLSRTLEQLNTLTLPTE